MTSSLPDIRAVRVDAILALREEYRREMNCQIVHDSWHARGFTHSYLFNLADQVVGYGSVGGSQREPKTTVKEFFVLPPYREIALPLFRRFVALSGARTIEAQTNGSYLVQELKRICRDAGHGPAARCNKDNAASRLTLQRAGMIPCGRIVTGRLAV